MKFLDVLAQMQKDKSPVIVYGAGNTADTLLEFFSREYSGLNIIGCAVSDTVKDEKLIHNISVRNIMDYVAYKEKATVFVAVVDKYIPDIMQVLGKLGFVNVISLSFESSMWEELRERYLVTLFKNSDKEYVRLKGLLRGKDEPFSERIEMSVYMACSHVDKEITDDFSIRDTEFLIPIQVGKALTDKNIADVHDDTGDNISLKNKAYSELTALYWLWKNVQSEWVGLCHYRRHFDLSAEDLKQIAEGPVDIVLTTPILNYPNVKEVYYRDHERRDWEIMIAVLKDLYPEYGKVAEDFFEGEYYCGYNMFIARKTIIDDYCNWLFPLLEKIEARQPCHTSTYQRRYIGFLAERLFSLYFISGINSYRIAYSRKHFYM